MPAKWNPTTVSNTENASCFVTPSSRNTGSGGHSKADISKMSLELCVPLAAIVVGDVQWPQTISQIRTQGTDNGERSRHWGGGRKVHPDGRKTRGPRTGAGQAKAQRGSRCVRAGGSTREKPRGRRWVEAQRD